MSNTHTYINTYKRMAEVAPVDNLRHTATPQKQDIIATDEGKHIVRYCSQQAAGAPITTAYLWEQNKGAHAFKSLLFKEKIYMLAPPHAHPFVPPASPPKMNSKTKQKLCK